MQSLTTSQCTLVSVVSFFKDKREEEGSQRMVINRAVGQAVQLVALWCSQTPPALLPERDPNLPDGLGKFSTFFSATRTKRHDS